MQPNRTYYLQQGIRYKLGYDDLRYGIWDTRGNQLVLVASFPKTPEGWQGAVERYKQLEEAEKQFSSLQNFAGVNTPNIDASQKTAPGYGSPTFVPQQVPPVFYPQITPNLYGFYNPPGALNMYQQHDRYFGLINKLSLWSMVAGIISLVTIFIGSLLGLPAIVAIVTGAICLSEIKNHPQAANFKMRAIFGIAAGILSLIFLVILIVIYERSHGTISAISFNTDQLRINIK